jgi:plastocyanin
VHKTIHRLTDLRIRQSREFFNVAPQVALDIFKDIAQTIDDAVITEYIENKPIEDSVATDAAYQHAAKRGRFKFSMVGIKIGETVTFVPTGIDVKVSSDDSVEYEGRIYKLSPFVGTFMPEDKQNNSGAYQGAKYFSYKGKILDELRREKENHEE